MTRSNREGTETLTTLDRLLDDDRVVMIFRGLDADVCSTAAQALHDGGFRWFEVTLDSPDPLTTIAALRDKLPDDAAVGAGTVLDVEAVRTVRDAGAGFVVSPHVDVDVITATRALGMLSIPGAFTATEILHAHRAGADAIKVFPIRPVGANYVHHLRGPFHDLPLIVTGGVNADLARECLAEGATGVGTGLRLVGIDPTGPLDHAAMAEAGRTFIRTAMEGVAQPS